MPSIIKIPVSKFEDSTLNTSVLRFKDMYENELEFAKIIKKLHSEGKSISFICNLYSIQYRTVKKYINTTEENKESVLKIRNILEKERKTLEKQAKIDEMVELYNKGVKKREVSRKLGIAFRTVNSYITGKTKAATQKRTTIYKIDKYKEKIISFLNNHIKTEVIYEELKK